MAIDFPASPTNGQVYGNWIYDSSITAWRNVNTDSGIGTLNAMGLKNIVPTSVQVGSGSATVNGNGAVTFSAASSISLNGVFSSTYTNYRIISSFAPTAGTPVVSFRYRSSGTDYSGAQHNSSGLNVTASTIAAVNNLGATQYSIALTSNGIRSSLNADVFQPNVASDTNMNYSSYGINGGSNNSLHITSRVNVTNQFDGFTFISGTDSISGSLTVYGYNN